MLRSIYRVASRDRVQKLGPLEPCGAVQEHVWRPAPSNSDVYIDFPLPDGEPAIDNSCHAIAPRWTFLRSPAGHQWFSHSSSQIGRSAGATSRKKSSMFFSANSCGMEPIWSNTMRLPTRRLSDRSLSWSRTLAGLPQATYPSFKKSLYRFSLSDINAFAIIGLRNELAML